MCYVSILRTFNFIPWLKYRQFDYRVSVSCRYFVFKKKRPIFQLLYKYYAHTWWETSSFSFPLFSGLKIDIPLLNCWLAHSCVDVTYQYNKYSYQNSTQIFNDSRRNVYSFEKHDTWYMLEKINNIRVLWLLFHINSRVLLIEITNCSANSV